MIPEADFARYAELGREIRRRFGAPLAHTEGRGPQVELALAKPTRINPVVIAEDIRQGERVWAYIVEGWVPGNEWQFLCDGISIGHKRIQWFDETEAAKIRLRVTESVAEPRIRRFAAYHA